MACKSLETMSQLVSTLDATQSFYFTACKSRATKSQRVSTPDACPSFYFGNWLRTTLQAGISCVDTRCCRQLCMPYLHVKLHSVVGFFTRYGRLECMNLATAGWKHTGKLVQQVQNGLKFKTCFLLCLCYRYPFLIKGYKTLSVFNRFRLIRVEN